MAYASCHNFQQQQQQCPVQAFTINNGWFFTICSHWRLSTYWHAVPCISASNKAAYIGLSLRAVWIWPVITVLDLTIYVDRFALKKEFKQPVCKVCLILSLTGWQSIQLRQYEQTYTTVIHEDVWRIGGLKKLIENAVVSFITLYVVADLWNITDTTLTFLHAHWALMKSDKKRQRRLVVVS
jgi:hypothetical protein